MDGSTTITTTGSHDAPQTSNTPTLLDSEQQGHHGLVLKGFELLALAATFMSAIQAQVMTATIGIGRDAETAALSAVNALFLAGLIFSITSAFLAFLTARWLQRLSNSERTRLEITFEAQSRKRRRRRISKRDNDVENRLPGSLIPDGSEASKEGRQPFARRLVYFYFAYSLFAPMTLLVTGVMCMAMGLWVFAWAEHSLAVGIVVTAVYFIILPFPVGVFLIGRKRQTRLAIIDILSQSQGDW